MTTATTKTAKPLRFLKKKALNIKSYLLKKSTMAHLYAELGLSMYFASCVVHDRAVYADNLKKLPQKIIKTGVSKVVIIGRRNS